MENPCLQDLSFVLADRWDRVDESKFGPELIIRKASGDFAIDDFVDFLKYIHDNVDTTLVHQLEVENLRRFADGVSALTRSDKLQIMEATVVRNRKGIICLDPFTPVFTGFWRKRKTPGEDQKVAVAHRVGSQLPDRAIKAAKTAGRVSLDKWTGY